MFSLKKGKREIFKIVGGTLNGTKVLLNDTDNISDKDFGRIDVYDGMIQQLPNAHERECIYVFGPSGAGKSTYVSQWAREYKNIYPRNNIVLISPIFDDDKINILNPIRIRIDDRNFIDEETRVSLEELRDSLVIFDDIDAVKDDELNKAIKSLRSEILLTGRHYNISSISTSHLACNYKDTRDLLNESHSITFFPGSGQTHPITRCLTIYCGLSKEQIAKIFDTQSRWITVHRKYPMYVMSKESAYLLKPKR